MQAGMWVIPAARMKMDREHRVPLTQDAVALLEIVPRVQDVPFMFPSATGVMMSDMTVSAVMRRMQEEAEGEARSVGEDVGKAGWRDPRSGKPAVPHGLRSSFRDWAAERGFERDMAEIALAHTVGSTVERAYRRSDMLERRRAMMQAWADYLHGRSAGTVVPFPVGGQR